MQISIIIIVNAIHIEYILYICNSKEKPMDWNSLSNAAITEELGKRVRATRMRKRLTQRELALKAGISLFSVAQIERGHPVSMSIFIPVLRVLRLLENLETLLPEMGPSPVEILKQKGKTPMRVRPKKKS